MAPTLDFTQFRAEDGSNTKRRIQGIYNGPASYATGGDPLVAADIKLGQIDLIHFGIPSNGVLVILFRYDYTNFKVKAFDMAGVEIAAATNLSAYDARFEAVGR